MGLLEAMDLPEINGWVLLQLAVGVLGYIVWTALKRRPTKTGLKRYDELPGPVELPILRSLHKVYMGPRPQINKLWTRMARAHGPLYKFRVPGKNFVVVSDHNLIPAILGRPGLPKTSLYLWTRTLFNPYGHDNLFTYIQHNDQEWKVVRKAFAKSMSAERIRTYYPIVLARTQEFCEQVRKRGPGAVDAQNAMQRLSLDVIMMAGFQVDPHAVDFGECEILDSLHYCFEEIFRQFSRPWRRLLFWAAPWLPAARVNQAFHDRLYGAWGKICDSIEAARATIVQDDPSFLACIAQQRELSTGELWSREKLMAHAAGVVVAGMDTTAHAVSWALFCISTYPGVQERVAQELRATGLLSSPSCPAPRPVEFSDIFDLPILDAVIKESMRMFPVGGSGIGRYADRDINLGGYLIPKGTEVAVCLHTLHNVPWNFPDPDRFDLDRWLSPAGRQAEGSGKAAGQPDEDDDDVDDGAKIAAVRSVPAEASGRSAAGVDCPGGGAVGRGMEQMLRGPTSASHGVQREKRDYLNTRALKDPNGDDMQKSFLPFSYGPRDCLGQRFGMMEVATMLACICGRFRAELAPQMGGEAGVLEKQMSSFTLAVDGGLFMHFHDRSQDGAAAAATDTGSAVAGQQEKSGDTRPVYNVTASTRLAR